MSPSRIPVCIVVFVLVLTGQACTSENAGGEKVGKLATLLKSGVASFSKIFHREKIIENVHKNDECLRQVTDIPEDDVIGRYQKLRDMQNANDDMFYACLIWHVDVLLPIVYTPGVGEVCQNYGRIQGDRGLVLKITEENEMKNKLELWKKEHRDTRAIVVTDGNRILGLGDLGANGHGIPIGKMIIYSALGGVPPKNCLPVTLDVGTDNEKLRNDNTGLYIGLKQERVKGEQYNKFVNKFVETAVEVFGPHTLIQFEDFSSGNAIKFLEQYKDVHTVFNDDIQGSAAVSLAGILAAQRVSNNRLEHSTVLFVGAGAVAVGIADILVDYMGQLEHPVSEEDARKKIFMTNSKGILMEGDPRVKADGVDRSAYAKKPSDISKDANTNDLLAIMKWLRPNILIGVSSKPKLFNEAVLSEMAKHHLYPIIFPLSNPSSKAECTAEEAYSFTLGTALFASGSPNPPVEFDGRTLVPRQCNNAYVFPGVALAVVATEMTKVPKQVFIIAAETLARKCTQTEDVNQGSLFPKLERLRECSLDIATAVAEYAFEHGHAAVQRPKNMREFIRNYQYTPPGINRIVI